MSEWLSWHGDDINGPVLLTDVVETELRDGTYMRPYPSEGIIWTHYNQPTDIIKYRIVNEDY